jgi:hypothetical protein
MVLEYELSRRRPFSFCVSKSASVVPRIAEVILILCLMH